jgi:hypothetical protein
MLSTCRQGPCAPDHPGPVLLEVSDIITLLGDSANEDYDKMLSRLRSPHVDALGIVDGPQTGPPDNVVSFLVKASNY